MYRVQCEKVVNFSVFASVLPKNGNSSNDLDRVYISGKGQFGLQFGKVEICGINTAAIKVLSEEEKRRLLERARSGDKTARDQLIEGNLRLVLSAIQRFSNRGENPDDLFQVGCIGLIKAIENFDLSLDVKFSTYVYPMIIGEVRRYLRDYTPVRVTRSMRDTAYRSMQAKEQLTAKLQREPTAQEIAERIGQPRQEVVMALESIVDPVSLYEPVYSDGGDTIYVMDQISAVGGGDEDWIEELSIREAIEGLSEREKRILSLRFMAGKTQIEVAEEIGISQAQVSRLEKGALDRIRGK